MSDSPKKPFLDRIFEFLPGFGTWLMLLSPIWLGLIAPQIVAIMLAFFSIYWVFMAFMTSTGALIGYYRFKKETSTDWNQKCKDLDFEKLPEPSTRPEGLTATKHLILVPTVNEPLGVLDQTFKALSEQSFELKQNMFVAVSCEERGAASVGESISILRERYKEQIPNILFYVHPAGIPGELIGGGAGNRTWGATHAIEELKSKGENLRNFIFTTFDADTIIHKEFISRLTYAYLTCPKRDNRFYSTALFLFDNNIWDVHPMMRIEANSITLGALGSWTINQDTQETFSCYSASLDTLIAANFWDVTLIDDTVFYWRAFFARKGDFKAVVFYTPNSSDAVHGQTFLKAHVSLYKQLVRWGWGSVTTQLALSGFVREKGIPLGTKLMWMYAKIERHLIMRTIVFLMTFGFGIMTLVNESVRQTTIAYRLPNTMSLILTIGLLFMIPFSILRKKLAAPFPRTMPWWRKIIILCEGPLIFINLLTFSFIPFLEAETKMMFGKRYKSLHFTPKYR